MIAPINCNPPEEDNKKPIVIEVPQCRYCLSTENRSDMVKPCKCDKYSRYVHKSCLYKWVNSTNNPSWLKCTTCLYNYELNFETESRFWKCVDLFRDWIDDKNVFVNGLWWFHLLVTLTILLVTSHVLLMFAVVVVLIVMAKKYPEYLEVTLHCNTLLIGYVVNPILSIDLTKMQTVQYVLSQRECQLSLGLVYLLGCYYGKLTPKKFFFLTISLIVVYIVDYYRTILVFGHTAVCILEVFTFTLVCHLYKALKIHGREYPKILFNNTNPKIITTIKDLDEYVFD